MYKDIRTIAFQTLLTTVLTGVIGFLISFIFGSEGIVEIASGNIDSGSYFNTIAIKNLKQSDYINNVEIIIDESYKISNLSIDNSKQKDENILLLTKIKPNDTKTISFITNKRLNEKSIKIVKNGQKIEKVFFNNYTNYRIQLLYLIFIYAGINGICVYITVRFNKKKNAATQAEIDLSKSKMKDIEKKISEVEKRNNVQKAIYLKEMNDMEKKIVFYQKLIIKTCNKKITRDELDSMISKELKTFNQKDFKHLNYEDIYKILIELNT